VTFCFSVSLFAIPPPAQVFALSIRANSGFAGSARRSPSADGDKKR